MRVKAFSRIVSSVSVACCTLILLPLSAANYVVTDLGTLGGDRSSATDLNAAGQVVGVARTADGRDHAFLWQNGAMADLGTLGGTNSHAAAINEAGVIVGWAETPEGPVRACRFGVETNADLSGGLPKNSYAADVNDHGRVVGWTENQIAGEDNPMPVAVLFRSNIPGVQVLSLWEGVAIRGRATAINNDDFVAGWTGDIVWHWGRHDRATVWHSLSSAASTRYSAIDSYVRGINAAGQIVGESGFQYVPKRATFWFGGSQLNLGSLALGSSTAVAINNRGQIVGSAEAYRFGLITNRFPDIVIPGADTNAPPPSPMVYEGYELTRHAFLWQNGVMADLNDLIPTDSGWELSEATSVNDTGQIVGNGRLNGQTRGFLLTPTLNPNRIPFIRVLSPQDGEWVSGSSVSFHAEAHDPDGGIRQVEFFARRVVKRDLLTLGFLFGFPQIVIARSPHLPGYLGTARNPWGSAYMLNVTNLVAGNYIILARATDSQGAAACAAEVLLRVNRPPELHLMRGRLFAPSPPLPPDNTLFLRLAGNEEITYDIETSTDFANWTKVGTIRPDSLPDGVGFSPAETTNSTHRFYRAVAR